MKNYTKLVLLILSLASFKANAIPVDIDALYVSNVAIYLNQGTPAELSATSTLPDVMIDMGVYQNPLFNVGDSNFGITFYSSSSYGRPAPSGYVDGTNISVDFSSLRASLQYAGATYSDIELWPLTTNLDYGMYDPSTSNYTIGWQESLSLDLSYISLDLGVLDVELSGYLTTVPVPAAAFLFGSGLLGLAAFARRRKAA